ncbi:MAG: 2,3-bisphosphoglycerate-independent phosphoglycerate mutase [Bacteroidia bacterium]|nr:2,3-bisphosphoglycerate-independent phosphoglycerate mutase [Bacteroidia bacterium]
MKRKVILMILDGWGNAPVSEANAVVPANAPYVFGLMKNYPVCELLTSGENVGLPDGQMGNSEVGHLNIGAGRIVYQELALIHKAIKEKTLDKNPVLNQTFHYALENNKPLHLMGLVSDGGVHSHINHLIRLCEQAAEKGLNKIFIHAFLDGRDTDPKSGLTYINDLIEKTNKTGARIASVIGRYYAMDRDKRWERVKEAYDLLVHGAGESFYSPIEAVEHSYQIGITDEFVKPKVIIQDGKPVAVIKPGDAVLCFNFRTDRCREITQVLTQQDMPEHGMRIIPLHYVTMTRYDDKFKNVNVIFEKDNLQNTLGEVISKAGLTQLRIAETEKYPHVTFFFSGGREEVFPGEDRALIASPKVATYDLQPEMSAPEVTAKMLAAIKSEKYDFICLNFANPDMVGHTGVRSAIIKAIQTVDSCVKKILECGLEQDYTFLITADHGNAEKMMNKDGSPNTAHTTNPVPCILVNRKPCSLNLKNGILADLAPSILQLLNVPVPVEMTGKTLLIS